MHPRLSVNAISFAGSALPAFAAAARSLDCRRVGLIGPTVQEAGATAARAALDTLQVETSTHNFVLGPLDADPQSWAGPRAVLDRLVGEVAALGGRSIYMLTGGHGGLDWEEAAAVFAAAIAPCLETARAAGVALMIENAPACYADLHLAHTLADAITLAERAGIGVCIELAACWAEADLAALIRRATPACRLIQVSDYVPGDRSYPCRAVPGDGAIPLERLMARALEAGYEGAFDLELVGPRIDREGHLAAARRAADRLGEMLVRLGA